MSMCTFGPKLEYLVHILMFVYILCTNDKLYVCKLHSDFYKGRPIVILYPDIDLILINTHQFYFSIFAICL